MRFVALLTLVGLLVGFAAGCSDTTGKRIPTTTQPPGPGEMPVLMGNNKSGSGGASLAPPGK
jgi:hypothetical protein